jgi:hypothetical protein
MRFRRLMKPRSLRSLIGIDADKKSNFIRVLREAEALRDAHGAIGGNPRLNTQDCRTRVNEAASRKAEPVQR